jgi:hypothetical protein
MMDTAMRIKGNTRVLLMQNLKVFPLENEIFTNNNFIIAVWF